MAFFRGCVVWSNRGDLVSRCPSALPRGSEILNFWRVGPIVRLSPRVILPDVVVQAIRQQDELAPVLTLNKTLHPGPPELREIIPDLAFSHSLAPSPPFGSAVILAAIYDQCTEGVRQDRFNLLPDRLLETRSAGCWEADISGIKRFATQTKCLSSCLEKRAATRARDRGRRGSFSCGPLIRENS
jgi:hypothetical protein